MPIDAFSFFIRGWDGLRLQSQGEGDQGVPVRGDNVLVGGSAPLCAVGGGGGEDQRGGERRLLQLPSNWEQGGMRSGICTFDVCWVYTLRSSKCFLVVLPLMYCIGFRPVSRRSSEGHASTTPNAWLTAVHLSEHGQVPLGSNVLLKRITGRKC